MDAPPIAMSGVFAARYTIEAALGHGATSTVYRARDIKTDRPVAIKILRRELAEALGAARFLREIKLTQALHHPRVLPILDSGESDGQLYFVAPYMDGGTLRTRLNHEPQLPLVEAVNIACTVAEALSYAHAQGFMHRDVKPENILFSGGEVCLADFGIARAIERSLQDTTTSTGIARGTPAYMSPEQASGAHDYDGRSDIYSLACVLYEMVTGMRPFMGPTAQAVISQRFLHPPRPLTIYRPSVPPRLQSIITHAMQVSAADRYRTAAEFAQALRAIPAEDFEKAQVESSRLRRLLATPARRVAAGAGLLAVVAAIATTSEFAVTRWTIRPVPDTTRLVLFPLDGGSARSAQWHDDDVMRRALSRWDSLHVVDEFRVADGLRRIGTVNSKAEADNLARSLGAARYIRGRISGGSDGWRVRVSLYDVRTPDALHTAEAKLPPVSPDIAAAYERLGEALLLRGATLDVGPGGIVGTNALPAVQAFNRAQTALDQWDMAAADSAFQAAIAFDPYYARASFRMLQVRAWRRVARDTWSSLADQALAQPGQLTDRERELANAVKLLGARQSAQACDIYSRLRDRDPTDFAAWFGLGQCRMADNAVIADPTRPSKWRFRSSVDRAMKAYRKAFDILPRARRSYERGAFEQLRNLLLVSQDIKIGVGLADKTPFYGRLALINDSLVMVAFRWSDVHSGQPLSIPPGFHEALAQRRAEFKAVAINWSANFPEASLAKRDVAVALELLGDASSIDTVRLARVLEKKHGAHGENGPRATELASTEVVFLIRFGVPGNSSRLKSARALADSLLSRPPPANRDEAVALAPVAALTGRCSAIDTLVRSGVSPDDERDVPLSVSVDAKVLVTRLAMGCPVQDPNLRTVWSQSEQAVSGLDVENHHQIEQRLLYRTVVFAPSLDKAVTEHFASTTDDQLILAARAVARGDTAGARIYLINVAKRSDPGAPTPDITLGRAGLWLALKDSTEAVRTLDTVLENSLSYSADALADPVNAGALSSMILLRAELAAAKSDTRNARRWSSAAQMLLSSADAHLGERLNNLSRYSAVR